MKAIKQSVTYLGVNPDESISQTIANASRTCYKSEAKASMEADFEHVGNLLKRNHTAMIEFGTNFGMFLSIWQFLVLIIFNALDHFSISYERNGKVFMSGNPRAWSQLIGNVHTRAFPDSWKSKSIFRSWLFGRFSKYHDTILINILYTFSLKGHEIFRLMNHEDKCTGVDYGIDGITYRKNCGEKHVPNKSFTIYPEPLFKEILGYTSLVHTTATFRFILDRGISHEFVRHRKFSFGQESTRYVAYENSDMQFILPITPWLSDASALVKPWCKTLKAAEKQYATFRNEGMSAQNARDVLPTCVKTELVMKGSLDLWKGFLLLRTSSAAHPKARDLAIEVNKKMLDLV